MRNRFDNAIGVQQGACNIAGVGRTLLEAIDQTVADGHVPAADPAVRLIVHQLASLGNVWTLNHQSGALTELLDEVRACASGDTVVLETIARQEGTVAPESLLNAAQALVRAADAARDAGTQPSNDVRVRLYLKRLYDLADVGPIDDDLDTYGVLMAQCRQQDDRLKSGQALLPRVFEVTAAGYDHYDEATGDRLIWVTAPTPVAVVEAIADTGATLTTPVGRLLSGTNALPVPVDFDLANPAAAVELRSKLVDFQQNLPVAAPAMG